MCEQNRMRIAPIKVQNGAPTVPTTANHNEGWLVTDIYEGEFALNTVNNTIYTRVGNTIVPVSAPQKQVITNSNATAGIVITGETIYVYTGSAGATKALSGTPPEGTVIMLIDKSMKGIELTGSFWSTIRGGNSTDITVSEGGTAVFTYVSGRWHAIDVALV